jgi:phosphoserine phosphatase
VVANTLEIEDGRLPGRVSGTVVDGARKAALLRELVQREGLRMAQAIAVGDGANDLPMLSIAGLGVAFRAKPIVAESADHAITHFGLDAILYLIGFSERDVREAEADGPSDLQGDARHATAPLPGHSSTVKT